MLATNRKEFVWQTYMILLLCHPNFDMLIRRMIEL